MPAAAVNADEAHGAPGAGRVGWGGLVGIGQSLTRQRHRHSPARDQAENAGELEGRSAMDAARAVSAASSEPVCGRHRVRHRSPGSGRDTGRDTGRRSWVCAPAPQVHGALSWKQGLPARQAGEAGAQSSICPPKTHPAPRGEGMLWAGNHPPPKVATILLPHSGRERCHPRGAADGWPGSPLPALPAPRATRQESGT